MKLLNPRVSLNRFWSAVRCTHNRVLMLDYDGTLAPFTVDRENARPYSGVPEILTALVADGQSRVVIISGRSIESLRSLIQLDCMPELWGSHGGERLKRNGEYEINGCLSRDLAHKLDDLVKRLVEYGWSNQIERKPLGVAIHYRGQTTNRKAELQTTANGIIFELGINGEKRFEVHPFDGGIELRLSGITKGEAVRSIIAENSSPSVAVYMGDDITDEDAFNAIRGMGLGVLVRQQFRNTDADLWLRPPEELTQFLRQWFSAISPGNDI